MSLITIILPVYNVEDKIPRCLDALKHQTLGDICVICVNDGSTDNTLKKLTDFAKTDDRFMVINQENHGVEYARSVALEHVQSPYFMFCDADDYYEPTMCQKMYEAIEKHQADMVMCQTYLEGDIYERLPLVDYLKPKILGVQTNILGLIPLTPGVLWNKIYKTDLIRRYQLTFPKDSKVRRGYDMLFSLQYLLTCHKVVYLPNALYHYVIQADSLCDKFFKQKKNFSDEVYGWGYVFQFMQKHHFDNPKILEYIDHRWSYLLKVIPSEHKKETVLNMRTLLLPFKKLISDDYPLLNNIIYHKRKVIYG